MTDDLQTDIADNPTITLESLWFRDACKGGLAYYRAHWGSAAEPPLLSECIRSLLTDGYDAWAMWMLKEYSRTVWSRYYRKIMRGSEGAWEHIVNELDPPYCY